MVVVLLAPMQVWTMTNQVSSAGGCSLEWKNRVCSGEGAQAALEVARSSQMSEQGSVLNSERRPGWFPGKGSLSSQEVELKPGLGQQESRNPGQQEFDNEVSRRDIHTALAGRRNQNT